MIATIIAALAVASLAASSGPDKERLPEWSLVAAQVDNAGPLVDFAAAFPTAPSVQAHEPENGNDSGSWIYDCTQNGATMRVQIDQFPGNIRVPAPTIAMYQLLLRTYAAKEHWSLQSARPVQMGEFSGLEGHLQNDRGETETRRILMVGRRVFQISYRQTGDAGADDAHRFLESFRITPR